MKNRKGFTIVEVIVILAIIGILAAVAVPVALRVFERTAEDATREEMDSLRRAMIGDSRKLQGSFRSDFGFLGDIGCLPASLDRLLTIGTLPAWSFDSTKQTGAGWKGPYITGAATGEETEEYTRDQLGNDYDYSASGACPLTTTLTSNGPDGQLGTADDIIINVLASETTATVRGKVRDTTGVGLAAVPVEFYSAQPDAATPIATTAAATDANGEYVFISAPFGARGVKAKPRFVYSPGTVSLSGGGNPTLSFMMVNYSESAETIDRVRLDYSGGITWDRFWINGTRVDPAGSFSSGQDVDLTDTAISASPAARPAHRVVIDSPDAQLQDIVVTGQGTAVFIEIRFNSNISGIPLTITFNPSGAFPPSVLQLTP